MDGAGGLLAPPPFGWLQLITGYSQIEGAGSAPMIPPIYILVTVAFPISRRWAATSA